ncbi:MAG: beta-lactamase family protein [Chlorobi bacterium]|nr:beta-lactamase family protein [Chlorobiota bacterium]
MRKICSLIVVSLFLSSTFIFTSCKKSEDKPTEAELVQNDIKALLDSIVENTGVPGLVAGVWAPDEGISLVYSAGVANMETSEPMSDQMVYRIGSETKTFTTSVLLQLVDEGLLSLDDPLSKYLPDFPRGDEVSIRLLAGMRSGIQGFMELDTFWSEVFQNPDKHWTYDEEIDLVKDLPFKFTPGTEFHYCNTNYILLGKIIEMVTGQSMEQNVKTRIIDPLDMTNTTYLSSGKGIPAYHSKAYYAGEITSDLPELSEFLDISWAGPAGCMISDIYDLKKYARALAGGELYSPELQQQRIICNDMGIGRPLNYGLGIYESNGFYGHDGQLPGYTSLMVHSPERNCTIVVWYNCHKLIIRHHYI